MASNLEPGLPGSAEVTTATLPTAALNRLRGAYQRALEAQARFQELSALALEAMGLEGQYTLDIQTGRASPVGTKLDERGLTPLPTAGRHRREAIRADDQA